MNAATRSLGLLLLRMTLGGLAVAYGLSHLMAGPEGWKAVGTMAALPGTPEYWGLASALAETVCGAAVFVGIFTGFAGYALALNFGTATAYHLRVTDAGTFVGPAALEKILSGGAGFTIALGASFLALALTGPGRISLRHALLLRHQKPEPAPAAAGTADLSPYPQ